MDMRRRPSEFMERRRSEVLERRPSERVSYGNGHPFAPVRRYPPSNTSWN
jgi:hypothetical protein